MPKFTDMNGNNPYTWEELPVIPSDRADLATFANTDRAVIEYSHTGMVIGRKNLTSRGTGKYLWKAISQAMVEQLEYFYGLAYFRFYPDAGGATYYEVYMPGSFLPKWQPGGIYDLEITLKVYSP